MSGAPDREFWRNFAEVHWERSALALKRPSAGLVPEPDEAWEILLRACDRYRAGERVPLRLYGEHGLVTSDLDALLPQASDGSFAAYGERVRQRLQSRSFTVVANYFHTHDGPLWDRARRFLAGLYAHVGLPAERTDVDLFVSDRKLTAFGIHRDPASNFTLVVAGHKKMRLWPGSAFDRRPAMDGESYGRHLERATTIEGDAGDLLYWPSSFWHVAESEGELSVALNLALYLDSTGGSPGPPALDVVSQRARDMVARRLGSPLRQPTYPVAAVRDGAAPLPAALEEALEAFTTATAADELRKEVAALWLNRVTGCGFNKVPPPRAVAPLAEDDRIRADSGFPILWTRVSDREIAVSANGRSFFRLLAKPDVTAMIDRLNRGEAVAVGELLDRFSPSAPPEEAARLRADLRGVLDKLHSWRAIERP